MRGTDVYVLLMYNFFYIQTVAWTVFIVCNTDIERLVFYAHVVLC